MDRIVDHVLAFEGEGKIRDFVGNFSEYREARSREEALEKNTAVKPEPVKETCSRKYAPSNTQEKTFKEQENWKPLKKKCRNWKKNDKILDQLNNEADYEKIAKLSSDWKPFLKNWKTMK
jgi:ATP-binding cassette subfamily F protein uup